MTYRPYSTFSLVQEEALTSAGDLTLVDEAGEQTFVSQTPVRVVQRQDVFSRDSPPIFRRTEERPRLNGNAIRSQTLPAAFLATPASPGLPRESWLKANHSQIFDKSSSVEDVVIEMEPPRPTVDTNVDPRSPTLDSEGFLRRRTNVNDSPDATVSWSRCNDVLRAYDDAMIKGWKEEIDSLLVFAGLFSAVLTAFNIQSYPALQPNADTAKLLAQISIQLSEMNVNGGTMTIPQTPAALLQEFTPSVPTSLIVINALWFTSLICSLVAASIGIFLKQWLREYTNDMADVPQANIRIRQYRYDGLVRWRVKEIVMLLPLLLQIALMLFLIGLEQLVWTLNSTVAVVVTIFVAVSLAFSLITAILPAVAGTCPYKSPQARVFFTFWQWQKSSARVASGLIYNLVSFLPKHLQSGLQRSVDLWQSSIRMYHNWSEREESHIAKIQSSLDKRALLAVVNARSMDDTFLETSVRPCLNDSKLDIAIACFHDILEHNSNDTHHFKATTVMGGLAVDIVARINGPNITAQYVKDHEEHILSCLMFVLDYYYLHEVSLDPRIFSALTTLLKMGGRITKRSWNLIKCFAHRFDTVDVKGVGALIAYAKQVHNDMELDPQSFLEACLMAIRLSTLLYNDDFEYTRSSLMDVLQALRTYLSTLSRSTVPSQHLLNTLAEHLPGLLQLARKDVSLVTIELVNAFEDIARTVEERDDPFMFDFAPQPQRSVVAKKKIKWILQNFRELHQQSAGGRPPEVAP